MMMGLSEGEGEVLATDKKLIESEKHEISEKCEIGRG
jgi:hypothetical protein